MPTKRIQKKSNKEKKMSINIGDKKQFKCTVCGAIHSYTIVNFNSISQTYLAEAQCPNIGGRKVTQQFSTHMSLS